ncbi:MAG TPA: transcriptional regulator [Xanthomonadaceae bacterium]|nr:transcriptional regulator [Xanthomonadaceae bacterium]
MKPDNRLSAVLHVLLHMAHHGQPLTSEALAGYMRTHPVVVRRTLAGLRELGYVASSKGHGGGWTLACDLDRITLLDVYRAVGAPPLIALGHQHQDPACLVAQAVNRALDDGFQAAERLLLERLAQTRLSTLAADFSRHHHPDCTEAPA